MKSHDLHRGKRSWKYDLGADDPHILNKEEAKLLRRLMSETGNTEEEIRKIPKYKRMLAKAQRSSEKSKRSPYSFWNRIHKRKADLWKRCRQATGLPNEHPLTKLEYNTYKGSIYRFWGELDPVNFTKKDIEYFEKNNINYK